MTGYSIDVEAMRSGAQGNDTKESSSSEKPKFSGWNLLAQAIDRILFITYLLIIFLFMASCIGKSAMVPTN